MSFPQDPDRGRPPKQMNAVLGLYDSPPHRDWLVWWTVGWTILAGIAIAFPGEGNTSTTSLPRWLDALLAAVVFGVLFGIFPTYIRLLIRRARYRKVRRGASPGHGIRSEYVPSLAPAAPRPAPSVRSPDPSTAPPPPPRPEPQVEWGPPSASPQAAPSPPAPARDQQPPVPPTPEAGRPGSRGRPAASGAAQSSKAPAGTTPINALDLLAVRNSEVLSEARSDMPYPVARAVRAVQGATSLRDVYEGVLRGAEALTVVSGVVAMTWAREHDVTTPQLADLGEAILTGGASQGHWIQALASIGGPMSQHPRPVAGLSTALKRGRGGSGLIADLNELVQERNRWAHGAAPRNELEASDRLQMVLPVYERAVEKARFLAECPWILTGNSRYRRSEGDFQVHASRAMGDHPDFEHTTFISATPLAEDVFYLHVGDEFIDMTPLVVMRQCPTCHQREVSYADRLDQREGVSLKTFDRGHALFDRSLVDEVRALTHGVGRNSDTA